MKLFTVKLTDDERAKLEAYRASRGLRSQSDAVRHLIAACSPLTGTEVLLMQQAEEARRAFRNVIEAQPAEVAERLRAALPIGPVKPKPGERLKKK